MEVDRSTVGAEASRVVSGIARPSSRLDALSVDAIASALGASVDGRRSAWAVRIVDRTGSTNTDLLADVRRGGEPACPALLVARRQVAGRGRLGRVWETAGGALTVSFALCIGRRMAALEGVTLVCGLAVRDVVAARGVPARLKWPNDVLVRDRKLAGILVEAHGLGDVTALVVGVGINVDQVPSATTGLTPTCLADEGCAEPDVNALVASLAAALAARLAAFSDTGFAAFAEEWRAADALAGRPVTVHVPGEPEVAGIGRGVDDSGALLVGTDDGVRRWLGGDVSLRSGEATQ